MAKKSRTPPPPRRPVQAPRTRSAGLTEEQARRRLRWLLFFAASGIVALAVVVAILKFASGSESSSGAGLAATMRKADCSLRTFKSQGRTHIGGGADPSTVKVPKYNSFPATSGPHYSIPAVFDIYDRPVLQVQAVHNLEHGGIVIRYGEGVPQSEVRKIADFYAEDSDGMLVAPLPGLKDTIAITAWTHLAQCPRFDEKAFAAFRDAYRFKGPERVSRESLKRGSS